MSKNYCHMLFLVVNDTNNMSSHITSKYRNLLLITYMYNVIYFEMSWLYIYFAKYIII